MFQELRTRSLKAGQPPGTAVYTGTQKIAVPLITAVLYSAHDFHEAAGTRLEECLSAQKRES